MLQQTCSCNSSSNNSLYTNEFFHLVRYNEPVTCVFQQCGILTSVDSDGPVQPNLSLETPNDVQSVA